MGLHPAPDPIFAGMMRQSLILAFIPALAGWGQTMEKPAKNLVPNHSFENYRKPSQDIRKAIPWRPIETVDYYQRPLKNDTTPERGGYTGECYAGLRFRRKYKEFIQVRLVEALKRGALYEFSMYIRLAFWSNAALKSFGVLFTKGGYRGQSDAQLPNMIDSICQKGALVNNYRWFEVKGLYKADGGEKFLTIGNFAPKVKKDMLRIDIFRLGPREAYYFVDEVSLVRTMQKEEKVEVVVVGPSPGSEGAEDSVLAMKENVDVGEKFALNHIYFDNDRYFLLPESNQELNRLAGYLMSHPGIEVRINGYSDNKGFKFRNQRMSELRAREVFEYLIRKGVQNKMYFKGFGSTQPVSDNDTEQGRAKNRRVEFEIIKK
jgi:OOP family OmpA-OmpF porin